MRQVQSSILFTCTALILDPDAADFARPRFYQARAGVAVVLFLPPGALQEWRAAVRQGLLHTIDWLDETMLVLTLPRGEAGKGYPLWWVCKHLLTPHVVQGFDHVMPVDQLAQTGMLNIRHLLRTARRYTLDVAHPSGDFPKFHIGFLNASP